MASAFMAPQYTRYASKMKIPRSYLPFAHFNVLKKCINQKLFRKDSKWTKNSACFLKYYAYTFTIMCLYVMVIWRFSLFIYLCFSIIFNQEGHVFLQCCFARFVSITSMVNKSLYLISSKIIPKFPLIKIQCSLNMLGNMYSTYLHYVKWTGSSQYGITCAWKPVALYSRCWGIALDRDSDSKVICKHKHWKYQEKYRVIGGRRGDKRAKMSRRNTYGLPQNKQHPSPIYVKHVFGFTILSSPLLSPSFILHYGDSAKSLRTKEVKLWQNIKSTKA